jgi:pimeloyl-ACP methyl ester carboxylesterase
MTPALRSFTYASAGNPPVRVWLAVPPSVGHRSRLLVVMHGMLRNAHEYAAAWADWSAQSNHVVVAPQFDRARWGGGAGYNLGNVLDETAVNPVRRWSFTVVDEIQALVRRQFGLVDKSFVLWGHSAGGQFAHRFPLFRPQAKLRAVIAAGCGWFTLPDPKVDFPYGSRHPALGLSRRRLLDWTRLPLVMMRGTRDVERDPHLRMTVEAEAQGANRFERAGRMLERGAALNPNCSWRLVDVPGVDHDHMKMIPASQAHWDSIVGGSAFR